MEMVVTLGQLNVFADAFWNYVDGAKVFAVHGPMGAGKTTTIAALCHYKGVQDAVTSPTFSIINEYVYSEKGIEKKIIHIDLYRLNDAEEIIQAGVEDYIFSGAICFVEWPEKAPYLFDDQTIHLLIDLLDANIRKLKIITGAEFNDSSMAEQL
ncbi:MAG: tRNA (adenosine(37)-N6)-threonylcarbamoyltransferase complex ATPase subunit type 1 TsaE [Flavisolibacter sp.]|nr:tRNA (adenosine(37)-N6)-threonylcarbamoyltransferase complex ATPase subunit type 1 TsaE [Flavisolibacter sp.]MBD0367210.1 tRNA (adenosine(37)-N6)-threonylcarbamoyltransferase complex ATPase subunit type 1 TsaE [Flavisolibacter sp.]